MYNDDRIRVELYDIEQITLIVPFKTGIVYTNQTGGPFCNQDEEEGFIIPLMEGMNQPICSKLERYFEAYVELSSPGLSLKDAKFIEETIGVIQDHENIEVDRSKLLASKESWVYVKVKKIMGVDGIEEYPAILTWPNSD